MKIDVNGLKFKLIVMGLIPIVFFSLVSFFYVLPLLRDTIFQEKEVQTQELVRTGLSILNFFHDMEQEGVLSTEEAQEQAKQAIRTIRFGDTMEDYFWINDFHPHILVHPFRQDLEGEDASGIRDPDGLHLFQEFVRVCRAQGSGFVPYQWQYYDDEQRIEPKISYVATFEPWNWIIGTGVYVNDVNEIVNTQRVSLLLLIIIIIVVTLVVIFHMALSITNPIGTLVGHLKSLATGDLSQSIPERLLKTKGEVGNIAVSLNDMITSMHKVVNGVVNSSSTLAASSEELTTSVQEVSKATQEVAQTIAQIAEGSTQQSRELEEITQKADTIAQKAETMNNMSERNLTLLQKMQTNLKDNVSSLAQIESAMQLTAEEGQNSRKEAERGQELLKVLGENIHSISRVAGEVSHAVNTLDARSQEIGKIVEMITGIAEQTNLLALNAAIEAARAGDAGRGFAVVAEEVRKLAEESAQAAHQISGLIEQIRGDTRVAVESMDKAATRVDEGVQQNEEVTRSFANILTAVQNSIQSLENLASTFENTRKAQDEVMRGAEEVGSLSEDSTKQVGEVTESITGISENINSVASVSEENAASSEEVSASTEEQSASLEEITSASESLAKLAQDLQVMVSQFKL